MTWSEKDKIGALLPGPEEHSTRRTPWRLGDGGPDLLLAAVSFGAPGCSASKEAGETGETWDVKCSARYLRLGSRGVVGLNPSALDSLRSSGSQRARQGTSSLSRNFKRLHGRSCKLMRRAGARKGRRAFFDIRADGISNHRPQQWLSNRQDNVTFLIASIGQRFR